MPAPSTACPVPCNLCGASDVDELSLRDRRGRFLRTTICRRCGLVWSNPRPPQDAIKRYYEREYRLDYKGRHTPSLRQIARSGAVALDRYQGLRTFLRPDDIVLDVGAGGGEFVYVLRQLGFDARGVEPHEEYSAHARQVLNVPVKTGFVQTLSFPLQSFTMMTMFHVLEHVEDPSDVLLKLKGWLAPDGVLVVEVPNVEATCQAPNHRFHFAHFYNFNSTTLEAVGQKAGFRAVHAEKSEDGGNLTCVFRNADRTEDFAPNSDNYRSIVRTLRNHRRWQHYVTPTPYVRVATRLRVYLRSRAAVTGCEDAAQVLTKLVSFETM